MSIFSEAQSSYEWKSELPQPLEVNLWFLVVCFGRHFISIFVIRCTNHSKLIEIHWAADDVTPNNTRIYLTLLMEQVILFRTTLRYWYFFGMTSLLSADKLSNQMIFKAIISNWHVLDIFEQKAQKCMFEITTNLTYNITIEINIVTCLSPKWVLSPEVLIHNTFRFIVFYASECHTWTSSSILLVCYRIAIRLHFSRKTPNMDRILFIEQST